MAVVIQGGSHEHKNRAVNVEKGLDPEPGSEENLVDTEAGRCWRLRRKESISDDSEVSIWGD